MTATEAERRRANGERPFHCGAYAIREAEEFTRWAFVCPLGDVPGTYALASIAVMLRALVLQGLVDLVVSVSEEAS